MDHYRGLRLMVSMLSSQHAAAKDSIKNPTYLIAANTTILSSRRSSRCADACMVPRLVPNLRRLPVSFQFLFCGSAFVEKRGQWGNFVELHQRITCGMGAQSSPCSSD